MIETTIPCLSLWQPWATLMASGAKKIETRSWATAYRGPLAIHAAKKWTREQSVICYTEPFASALEQFMTGVRRAVALPFGTIVCVVDVDDCLRVERLERINANRSAEMDASLAGTLRQWGHTEERIAAALEHGVLTDQERAFGDYSPGRFAWLTGNLRKLARPVPCRGGQRIFRVPLPAELSSPSPRAQE